MKKFLFLLALVPVFWSSHAAAATCTTDSLANYVKPTFAPCSIGNATFSNFTLLATLQGATLFDPITVTPYDNGVNLVGFDFVVTPSTLADALLDTVFAYQVTGLGSTIGGASASLNGSAVDIGGSATLLETYCLGGTFNGSDGVSNCSKTLAILNLYDVGFDAQTSDALPPFTPVSFVSVVTDIGADSRAGSASLQSASNRFVLAPAATTPVPEPGVVLLLAAGLLAAVAAGRRTSRRS